MALHDAEIAQIVTTICQSVLGIDATQVGDVPPLSAVASAGTLSACVQITGAWQGAVVLGCTDAFAIQAATIMFTSATEDRNLTDMQDAVAEISNMIGGNLKGLLTVGDACQLSLPSVVAGADYITRIPKSRPLHRIAMECGGHVIVVTVLEKIAAVKAA